MVLSIVGIIVKTTFKAIEQSHYFRTSDCAMLQCCLVFRDANGTAVAFDPSI
jgi:hypothetical protein